jgi:hypothetical protein
MALRADGPKASVYQDMKSSLAINCFVAIAVGRGMQRPMPRSD